MKIEEYVETLERAKQIVLTGAPGTGKTYLAKQIAEKMILANKSKDETKDDVLKKQLVFVQFHPSYDYTDFVEGLRPVVSNDDDKTIVFARVNGEFKQLCERAVQELGNFDLCYKKFISTVRETQENAESSLEYLKLSTPTGKPFRVGLNRANGLDVFIQDSTQRSLTLTESHLRECISGREVNFKSYYEGVVKYLRQQEGCELVPGKADGSKKYVIVIDEINRGDISKIFGELFYAIDVGYRGEKGRVRTQYQTLVEQGDVFEDGFYVPNNVYIIGTMNDVDRNVESIDFAIRRRFTWLEVTPMERFESMMSDKRFNGIKKDARRRMQALNELICNQDSELGPAFQIGPSYFCKLKEYDGEDRFEKLWENHLEPLLREYYRGIPNADYHLGKMKKVYFAEDAKRQEVGSDKNDNGSAAADVESKT